MLLSATSTYLMMVFHVQKSFKTFFCYKTQKCCQTPRSSHVPRHSVSPEYPVPTVSKGLFCPGPHMFNFTRQFHPRHPTCQELKCHFLSVLLKFFFIFLHLQKEMSPVHQPAHDSGSIHHGLQ